MRSAANPEMEVRLRQTQVIEECLRHIGIVMLAGMNDPDIEPGIGLQCMKQWRDFHEIRARCGYQMYQGLFRHSFSQVSRISADCCGK